MLLLGHQIKVKAVQGCWNRNTHTRFLKFCFLPRQKEALAMGAINTIQITRDQEIQVLDTTSILCYLKKKN